MKNLKIKLGLFSLLAILAVSVCMTSCEQKEVLDEVLDETIEQQVLILPKGYDTMNEEEMKDYFGTLTIEDSKKLVENNRIASFLFTINKLKLVDNELTYGQSFVEVNLSLYLSKQEIQQLNNFKVEYELTEVSEDVLSRGWWGGWNSLYTYQDWFCLQDMLTNPYNNGNCCESEVWSRE